MSRSHVDLDIGATKKTLLLIVDKYPEFAPGTLGQFQWPKLSGSSYESVAMHSISMRAFRGRAAT